VEDKPIEDKYYWQEKCKADGVKEHPCDLVPIRCIASYAKTNENP
jgi:hypothetical protein